MQLPENFIELYNLTTEENKCELSVHFYAKSVLRGYLKSWLTLAEKRYILKDYDGAHLLYSYTSFLGLPQGSFSAGYSWHKERSATFKCSLNISADCALFYYFQGIDFYRSLARAADILLYNFNYKDLAFKFFEMASKNDGYSLYTMA
jgi:hypothetical protein